MPQAEKEKAIRMNNICGLHYLVGLAEQTEALLRQWDKSHFEGQLAGAAASGTVFDRGEAGIVWLVCTACKVLQRQGSEQAGCYL